MPLAAEIIGSHAGTGAPAPGELATVDVDHVYLQDGNTPTIRRLFERYGFDEVFDAARISAFFDHAVLSPTAAMSDRLREAQEFADALGINVYAAGRGVSHVVALERGLYRPRDIVVAADSHTCTGGAVQCLALGMGASDVAAAMVTGRTWLRVPETVWIRVSGAPSPAARTKDVMLYALASFGQEPFLYRSLEWCGEWLEGLSLDAAATMANMAVELGCKCCFMPDGPGRPEGMADTAPDGSGRVLELDLAGLPPMVARPHDPASAVPLDECAGSDIDYVFIGSCTNGRYEDLVEAADVLRERAVAPGVQCVVTPGSLDIHRRAVQEGIADDLLASGALLTPASCGPCVGTQGPVPAAGARVLATSSRNFRGRMGNPDASIWLSSPLVAAHTAATGRLPRPEELVR